MKQWSAFAPALLSVLRIVTALLFVEHGLMKLAHFPIAQPGAPTPLPPILLVAALLEVVGGGLLTLGLFTRSVAFVLSGQMAIAYFLTHGSRSLWPGVNGGAEAILYCFVFFYISAAGPGSIAVDAMRRKRF